MADENKKDLAPGKYFPADMTAPSRDDILGLLARFGFRAEGDIRLIDSSFAADDLRLNYIVDKKWVLRLCNAPDMTEKRLGDLNRLIGRYKAFGLRCPAFLPGPDGKYLCDRHGLACYLSEYIDLPTAWEMHLPEDEADVLWREVMDSVAGFAERYRDTDLIDTMGMYSLFDLSPFDKQAGKDEKRQNLDGLLETLRDMGRHDLAGRLNERDRQVRAALEKVYRGLPRCVFQGDENFSNVLVDETHHMAGLIDFNLAGTEVIVNQFANMGGGFDEEIEKTVGARVRLEHAVESYRRYKERLLNIYHATDEEKRAMKDYTWIALAEGWPQICFFQKNLKNDDLKDEVLELLALIADELRDMLA